MFETWLWLTLTAAAAAAAGLWMLLEVKHWNPARVVKSFRCPTHRQRFTVTFRSDPFDLQRYRDVLACTAFADPTELACGKECLTLGKDVVDQLSDLAPR